MYELKRIKPSVFCPKKLAKHDFARQGQTERQTDRQTDKQTDRLIF